MNAILLTISIFMNLVSYGIVRSAFCKKEVGSNCDLHLFNAASSLLSMAALAIVCLAGSSLSRPSLYTVLLGIVFGLCTALCALLNMKALESGPLSYTNVIVSCSMVIPALSGMILYQETVSFWQLAGVLLMIASFLCAVDNKNTSSGASLKGLLYCLGAFLFSGSVGILQKVHQSSPHRDELGIFLIIAFGVSAIFSSLSALLSKKRGETITVLSGHKLRSLLICSVLSGIGIALCNQINMYLAGAMDAILFYPVVNGASMILTAAAGILLWRERLTVRQWSGLCMGGAAILLLCGIL